MHQETAENLEVDKDLAKGLVSISRKKKNAHSNHGMKLNKIEEQQKAKQSHMQKDKTLVSETLRQEGIEPPPQPWKG